VGLGLQLNVLFGSVCLVGVAEVMIVVVLMMAVRVIVMLTLVAMRMWCLTRAGSSNVLVLRVVWRGDCSMGRVMLIDGGGVVVRRSVFPRVLLRRVVSSGVGRR
jgi:hypothetical protein